MHTIEILQKNCDMSQLDNFNSYVLSAQILKKLEKIVKEFISSKVRDIHPAGFPRTELS